MAYQNSSKLNMEYKNQPADLPPEIACIHRKWNVRSVAYRNMINHFQKLDPSSDEWSIYKNVIPNMAAENFPAIREQALEAVFYFVQKCEYAQKMSSEIIHAMLDTLPTNMKPRAKHWHEQIILQYIENGCSRDVIDELLKTALLNQAPNVATSCIEFITEILSVFSPKAIDLAYVLETLPYLQEAEDWEFRSATKALILEIYRWQGKDSIKNVEQILNPTDLKDVVKKYEEVKQATKLKPSRHVRVNKSIDNGTIKRDDSSLEEETDLLKQIGDDFFKKLDSPEWTERRDVLMELSKTVESTRRLRPGNFEPLLAALKKVVVEDQCVIVVGLAIASITGIARGLREQFSPYAVGMCRILLDKFVEKRQNITEQLRKALDVLITTTSFESLIKTINGFLGSKNPTIRFETIQLLSRMFKKTTRQTLRKSEFSILYKSLVNCLHHGQLIIREKSFIALAVAFKIAGEGVIMPYLESVDPAIRIRIKNFDLEQDFEETYNEIKYRNVAKKDLKNEDKKSVRKDTSPDSYLKEKVEKLENETISITDGRFKTQTERKRVKPIRKKENEPVFNYNKVTKRWSASNSNDTMRTFQLNSEWKETINNSVDVITPFKEHKIKENVKRYPYRKPYTVQRKDISNVFAKDKRKKKKIFTCKKKCTPEKKELEVTSEHVGDNLVINLAKVTNNTTKLQSQIPSNKPSREYSFRNSSDSPKKREQIVKSSHMYLNSFIKSRDIPTLNKDTVKIENMSLSASTQENSEVIQPVQQSVQTLESKCGEGFIVLTENEVKKLLGLKRASAMSDDSCILPEWTSKKNLFKRSYKIFQVSKGATDRETQTSRISNNSSSFEIYPEGGVMDLTKTADVIPTQTATVTIEEKGTDAQRIKRYNRGTQWVQHVELDTVAWSKRETSAEWQELDEEVHQCQHKEEAPVKMQSLVMKKIEYRRPSVKDVRRRKWGSSKVPSRADRTSKRTMQINTFTVTRSDPMAIEKNTSESQASELTNIYQERNLCKHHKEQNRNLVEKEKKRHTKLFSKLQDGEDNLTSTANDSRQIKKVKRKYMHEIMVQSNKATAENRENNISSQTLIRLKKFERTKHRSQTKRKSERNLSKTQVLVGHTSHRSDVSILRSHRKGRRSTFTKSSKFKYENCNDTSSGSCKEGCNFLPFVTKNIMGRQNEQNERKNRLQPNKQNPQRNAKRGQRPDNEVTSEKKSEHSLGRRRCYSAGHQVDARDMDPETKKLVINELLKVCDISQSTFEKMVRRKMSPPRPCLFAQKAVQHRTTDLSSEQETTEDRNPKEHKSCVLM